MMTIKCVITDDEPIARKGIRGYIEQIDFLQLVGECEDALQLNKFLAQESVDLVFLDIEMPRLSGMELLAQLKNPPRVIIISAYERYALKGYELDVVDYLLKPVSFDRFLKAVNKVHDLFENTLKATNDEAYLFVKSNKLLKKVVLTDILFVESMENYVVIQTHVSKEVVYMSLKTLLEHLPTQQFLQVHRSFIVNKPMVQAIEGNQLLIGNHKIPVARNLREEVFRILLEDKLISK